MFSDNKATAAPGEFGGGLCEQGDGTTVTVTDCTFTGNVASQGGGAVANDDGSLTVIDSTIGDVAGGNGNSALSGGGVYNSGSASITSSTVAGNESSNGGGIYVSGGSMTLTNSTVANNTATGQGGGIDNQRSITIVNATIADNVALGGAGSGGGIDAVVLPTDLYNTIVAQIADGAGATASEDDIAGSTFDIVGTYDLVGADLTGRLNAGGTAATRSA